MSTTTPSRLPERPGLRYYLSLLLLFVPALAFPLALYYFGFGSAFGLQSSFPFLPWQFWVTGLAGGVATVGGVLDWRFHRDPLKLNISKREREAEAKALGLGGLPMLGLMLAATLHPTPRLLLVPIIVVLIYTVVAICYDEFVFHIHRCGRRETIYHRMLVFGNGLAWLAWFHFIYVDVGA